MDTKTMQQLAKEAAEQIRGKTIAEVFSDGPRSLFVEYQVPRHGIYRLYIARPFGVRKPGGQRWRIQITVQFDGQDVQQGVNDGYITVPFGQLGEVIVGAAEQMEEHIRANSQTVQKLRRAAMQAVQPDAVTIGDAGDAAPACVTHGDAECAQ
ncbi:hypothetical protein [Pseudomonas sp. SO81]|uniref:hypothetical protein n=1 Tax=Pseudomonas sp. SO81 TaxID=2983246 RepID=UPI0025A42C37|nr:hypothetical protein [Pseudomonas sp. SO81]WJN61348.1 hypothetical protein OH686_21605 [Pseudomonas sp. SO81]